MLAHEREIVVLWSIGLAIPPADRGGTYVERHRGITPLLASGGDNNIHIEPCAEQWLGSPK